MSQSPVQAEGREEEEDSGSQNSQKALEKGQGAQRLEGNDVMGLEPLGGGEERTVGGLVLRLWGLVF